MTNIEAMNVPTAQILVLKKYLIPGLRQEIHKIYLEDLIILKTSLLNNPFIKEEIKKKIRKCFQQKRKTLHTRICGCH